MVTSAGLQNRLVTRVVRVGLLATLGCFPRDDLADYSAAFPGGSGGAGNAGSAGANGTAGGGAGGAGPSDGIDAGHDAADPSSAPDTGLAPLIDAGDLDAGDAG